MNPLLASALKRLTRPRQLLSLVTGWRLRRTYYYLSTGQYRIVVDRLKRLVLNRHPERLKQFPQLTAPVDLAAPLGFPPVKAPEISIIIPVYNKVGYTHRCLASIQAHSSRYSYEVIVVDDCSSDATGEILQQADNLRLISNEQNLGFIHSCNKGASLARGKYLLFLNNDTYVLPGWMDELRATFDLFPDAGLVGSKLLFPNGALQEAGGILWSDASGWNYGRDDDPEKPEYGYLREADYCSGASIMVPQELFRELGGFDTRYAPAYFEDADLAFAVRQAGRKTYYQPLSQVVHFEGISSGTDTSSGVKACQVANREKFLDKWQTVLARHRPPGQEAELEKERDVRGRILIVDNCTPMPDRDAGSVTAFFFMRIFRQLGYKVTFIPAANFAQLEPYTSNLQRIGVECLYAPYVTSVVRHLRRRGRSYDFVLLYRVDNASRYMKPVRRYCPSARVVFDTVDLHFLREQRQAELENSPSLRRKAAKTKGLELRAMKEADCTIVLSDEERKLLHDMDPSLELSVIPLLLDTPGSRQCFSNRRDILFIGGFMHTPNVDAVLFFGRDIWPLLRQQLPDLEFFIIGSHPPAEVLALEGNGIRVVGYVENLEPYFDRCRLSVVPLRYGAGIKGKIGTSLSFGVPCVATSLAVEGMGLSHGENVLLADSPGAFADTVVRLYQDEALWNHLSREGLAFVSRHYSLETGRERLRDILDRLGGSGPSSSAGTRGNMAPPFHLNTAHSKAEYEEYRRQMAEEYVRRDVLERSLIKPGKTAFETAGFCHVCGKPSRFMTDFQYGATEQNGMLLPNWRERLVCRHCGLNNRVRAAIHLFQLLGRPTADSRIYVTEQVTPLYKWVRRHYPRAVGSEYLGEALPWGETDHRGVRNESVTRLTFPEDSLDYLLSFDVFEHVPDHAQAFRECLRCLKPGGMLLFTVPFRADETEHLERAAMKENGEVAHLLPPEYHGDPNRSEGCLCFRHFGWSLLDDLRTAGFAQAAAHLYWSEQLGYLGGEQITFTGFKP
jgi:GT2 family glycosyltransferase/glycosyltransferase involved in cell wall biosynthesis/SAM-dependent methyltransferase